MQGQANQICYQAGTLWVKQQLRSATILSSKQSMLNSLQNGRGSVILAHTINATISTQHSSSTSVNFYIPIPPLIFHKIILTLPTNPLTLPSSIPLRVLTSLFLRITKNIFATLTISPIQSASRNQGARKSCDEWHYFNLPLLPQSMDSDNTAHSQSQKKISILIYILI